MADQIIPSTHGGFGTLITDSYARTIVAGPPDPPEPPRREDKKLTRRELGKKFKLSDDETSELIERRGFPAASRRVPFGSWAVTLVWSEHLVDEWAARERAEATRILELLG
jgi:hypothetical protein